MTSKSNHLPAATTMHTTMLQWLGISIRGVMRTRHGAIGLVLLVLLALVAMAAPSIATFGPFEQTASSLAPPGAEHYFGTDNVGRDIFSMVIYGTRASLAIGFGAAFAALIIGG